MCTAIRFDERFFGRTLDFERGFSEEIVITPREKLPIGEAKNRYAIMGVGTKIGHTPLYFDGINEWGLAAAALHFPGCAVYHRGCEGRTGVASGHFVSLVLGLCRSVSEARDMLGKIFISDERTDMVTPPSPLHWLIADSRESIVVEPLAEGLRVYDNKVGVLTNSPELPYHLTRLADYSSLRAKNPESRPDRQPLYSRGLGAFGLPGDYSSASRFVRAAFVKENTRAGGDPMGEISRVFHILDSVSVPLGCVLTDKGDPVATRYTVCADLQQPTYYLTTASCRTVRKISLTDALIEGEEITSLPIYRDEIILDL